MCVICLSYHDGTLPVGLILTQVGDVAHIGLVPDCTPEARSFFESHEECSQAVHVSVTSKVEEQMLNCRHPSPCEEPGCLGCVNEDATETYVDVRSLMYPYGFSFTFTRLGLSEQPTFELWDDLITFSTEDPNCHYLPNASTPFGGICNEVAPMTPTEILGVITEWTQLTVDDINQLTGLGDGIVLHNGSYRPISRNYQLPGWDEEE
jgi:hypothetical protein